MPTEQQVAAVVLTAVNAALPATGPKVVRAYDPSTMPDTRPPEFVVVTVTRRAGGTARAGRFVRTGWDIFIMAASSTAVANARNSLRLAASAIESQVLTVDGLKSTPVRFANARTVGPDDDYFSGVSSFTCSI